MRIEKTFSHQFGQVIERYHAFAKEHNDVQFVTKSTMLREPHLSKLKSIAHLYLKQFWNCMNSPLWADSDRVPLLQITRWDLANLCGCSRRAVQDHLARLSTFGVITVEEFEEGRVNGYKIALNLWLLLGIDQFKPKIQSWSEKPTTILKAFSLSEVQTLPHLSNQIENLNNSYIAEDVENLSQERHQENGQEKQEIAQNLVNDQESCQEKNMGGAENSFISSDERFEAYRKGTLNKIRYQNAPKPEPKGLTDIEKATIINNFWKYVKDVFYPQRNYTPIESEIKKVIHRDVFNGFKNQNPKENTFEFWQIYSMTLQYWADKKQAFDARKDREAYHPTKYFSKDYGTHQKQGFLVVLQWAKKAEKSLREIEFEKELERAKLTMMQYPMTGVVPRGQGNKIKDITQLAQYYTRKLSVKTNSDYVQKFNEFLTTTNFLRPCNQQHQHQ